MTLPRSWCDLAPTFYARCVCWSSHVYVTFDLVIFKNLRGKKFLLREGNDELIWNVARHAEGINHHGVSVSWKVTLIYANNCDVINKGLLNQFWNFHSRFGIGLYHFYVIILLLYGPLKSWGLIRVLSDIILESWLRPDLPRQASLVTSAILTCVCL